MGSSKVVPYPKIGERDRDRDGDDLIVDIMIKGEEVKVIENMIDGYYRVTRCGLVRHVMLNCRGALAALGHYAHSEK